MRNLMMFHGSCGHTEVTEISDLLFEKYTLVPGHGPLGEIPPCQSRTGKKTRMVYVWPARYFQCLQCAMEDFAEDAKFAQMEIDEEKNE